MPLTRSYIQTRNPSSSTLLYEHIYRQIEKPGTRHEQIVVLSQVLPSQVNSGYSNIKDFIVHTLNGIAVRSLSHLKTLLKEQQTQSKYYVFENEWSSAPVVLEIEKMLFEERQILERYGISQKERL